MALAGDRFREIDVPAIPTLGRRRSARAPPAEPFMGGMARRPDGTPSEDRDHLRGRPTLFSGRARTSLFTVVKLTLSRHFQKRLSVKQRGGYCVGTHIAVGVRASGNTSIRVFRSSEASENTTKGDPLRLPGIFPPLVTPSLQY